MDKTVTKLVVDKETGEYVEIYVGDKLKITRKEQQDGYKKVLENENQNLEIKEWNEQLGGFVFVMYKYCDNLMQNHPEITNEDIAKLFYLSTFVDYDGYLVLNSNYMKRQDMTDLLSIHRSNFDVFFNKMKDLQIFIQDTNKNIKINKDYFCKGEVDTEIKRHYTFTRIYIDTIRYLFDHVPVRRHKQLGYYFKMIPYIHRQTNVLCWNPNSNAESISLMHVNDLKDILGCHEVTVRNFIKNMLSTRLDNGESILGFFRTELDEGKSYIIINPKVFYGGNFQLEGGKNSIVKWFAL